MCRGADLRPRPGRPGRVLARALLPWAVAAAAACGDGPAAPSADAVELAGAGPTLQFAPPGRPTPDPLRVQVRRRSDLAPRRDVEVSWSVAEGSGAVLARTVSVTDSAGIASVALTLGPGLGRYVVRASLVAQDAAPVEFEAWAVEAPVLARVPEAPVAPGSRVVLEGSNFSPVPEHDVVLFGGVRARVLTATPDRLEVEVPPCLPARLLDVTVSLGAVRSEPHPIEVGQEGVAKALAVGASLELDGSAPTACVRLPAGGRYLALLRSAGTVAGALYPVGLRALAGSRPAGHSPVQAVGHEVASPAAPADLQGAWDRTLRRRERELLESRPPPPPSPEISPSSSVSAVPSLGEKRTFQVLSGGGFVEVEAVVRHVGREVVLYEDVQTPASVIGEEDYALTAARFDDLIHPVVTGAFGDASDLDGNDRVIVLMTPEVNRLTPRGSDGFIGGFFYGLDLLVDRTGSNRGELFYTLVPDPEGVFGDVRPRNLVAAAMPAILAHEFQHMIHFNERILERGAPGGEAVWLSEGLAQMAEDLVAREARARGEKDEARLFDAGNHARARRFLQDAPRTSLIIGAGSGSLAERGAGWLFVRYLEEQYGGVPILGSLTRTTRTSTDNVATVTGVGWAELLGGWGVALFDGEEPGLTDPVLADARHRYPVLRPRRDLVSPPDGYPLTPKRLGDSDGGLVLEAPPAAPAHVLIDTSAGPVTLAVGRADGGATSAAAGVYLRIVRLE